MTNYKYNTGVIGGGKMGKSLFNMLNGFDNKIVWINRSNHINENKKFERKLERSKKNELINDLEYSNKKKNVIITDDLNYLIDCDIVIETITEHLDLKNELFHNIESFLNPSAILVSNSSSILPVKFTLSQNVRNRFAGLHFFYPAEANDMVELIAAPATCSNTIEKLKDFCMSINKKVFVQDSEKSAFFINRFFLELESGLFNYCSENDISFAAADNLIKKEFFTVSIFEIMDKVGANILHYAITNYKSFSTMLNSPEPLLKYIERHLDSDLQSDNDSLFIKNNAEENLQARKAGKFISFVKNLLSEITAYYMKDLKISSEQMTFIISEYTNSQFDPLFLNVEK